MTSKIALIKDITALIGKGTNRTSYNVNELETLLKYTNTEVLSKDLLNINIDLYNRLSFGEHLNLINQLENERIHFYHITKNELFIAKANIDTTLANSLSINKEDPQVLKDHYFACIARDKDIYYHHFTSTPIASIPYNVFSNTDLFGRNITQYISKYPSKMNNLYVTEIVNINNTHPQINTKAILFKLENSGYFESTLCFDNKYSALIADSERLNKVKKNINLYYSLVDNID
jgi:hypothetical protein